VIYEITREVETELKARGVPLPVVYGPERGDLTITFARIVIERDRDKGDAIGPGRGRTVNPQMVAIRSMGAVCRVYAQSTESGAGVHDHERMADQAVDRIHVALEKIVKLRTTLYHVTAAKLLSAQELAMRGLLQWPGVVYELRFSVDRGVFDTDWTGAAKPESVLGTGFEISSTTKATLDKAPDNTPPETACGA